MEPRSNTALTVLLTGLPSAGKSTLATAAVRRLACLGYPAESLDGDVVRRLLWPELGMSRADREQNLGRITVLTRMLVRNGVTALVSAIAPFGVDRHAMRAAHTEAGLDFVEVHVATPLAVCRHRDVKGLYARQARGEFVGLTAWMPRTNRRRRRPSHRHVPGERRTVDGAAGSPRAVPTRSLNRPRPHRLAPTDRPVTDHRRPPDQRVDPPL